MDFQTNLYANFPRDVADKILASLDEKRTHGLLLNTNKIGIREFYSRFPRITSHPFVNNGFLYNREEYDFGKLFYQDLGVYYLQEPSAMSIVSFLDIKPGEIVLDMCAAPGGKALQASLRTGEKGLVLANDISHSRALVLSSNVERLGLGNIVVTNNDFSSV
ncbi:MAG TPA: SAM-dependent methyltransferase, partial [Bacilli bacterium]|nr:SAM-dependent methyltransferase [Bacilli bacterium]